MFGFLNHLQNVIHHFSTQSFGRSDIVDMANSTNLVEYISVATTTSSPSTTDITDIVTTTSSPNMTDILHTNSSTNITGIVATTSLPIITEMVRNVSEATLSVISTVASATLMPSTHSTPSTSKMVFTSDNNSIIGTASSSNFTTEPWEVAVKVIPLAMVMIMIVLGNLLVIVAVLTQRYLRTPPNILILSLAVADLTVGVFILPLNVIEMMLNHWPVEFGKALCRTWLTSDVTLCSTSILHIAAIAMDRYRSINEGISYISQRTIRTAIGISISLWVVALWIASAPALGWNDWDSKPDDQCMLPQNLGYIIHSALGAFFLPGFVMVIVYVKIFFRIKQRFRDRAKLSCVPSEPSQEYSDELTDEEKRKTNKKKFSAQISEIIKTKIKFSLTKEKKAAQTLGIIIGAFVICWTPFTLTYLTMGVCIATDSCEINVHWFRFVTWLGYVNSGLNPIIYTIYSQEFRRAFKAVLHINSFPSCRKPTIISSSSSA